MSQELGKAQMYTLESLVDPIQQTSVQEFIRQINESAALYLQQKFDAQQLFTGCVAPRVYKLYGENYEQQPISNKPIIYAKEKSSCFTRHFCTADYRPFQMNLFQKYTKNTEVDAKVIVEKERDIMIQLDRKFKCTFYCLFRPSMEVTVKTINGAQKFIGRIVDPFDFCPPREWFFEGVDIHDSKDNLLYIIEAHKFKCGIMFGQCCCSPCQEVKFNIISPGTREVVGYIEKKATKCLKNMTTGHSSFKVTFPVGIGFEQKILVLAATFFIQANMFVENPEERLESLEDILEIFT